MVKMYHPLKISKLEILRDHYNAKNSFIVTQQKPLNRWCSNIFHCSFPQTLRVLGSVSVKATVASVLLPLRSHVEPGRAIVQRNVGA